MFEEDMMQEEWNGFHKTDFAHTHTHKSDKTSVWAQRVFRIQDFNRAIIESYRQNPGHIPIQFMCAEWSVGALMLVVYIESLS